MLSEFSYPIICTGKFSQTVNFYEDHFRYVPAFEMQGFVILQREDKPDLYLAVIDKNHEVIPEKHRKAVQGMILSYPVDKVDGFFQELYWEGVEVINEPENALCGRKHFFVEDPNGILIDVAENMDLSKILDQDKIKEICIVAGQKKKNSRKTRKKSHVMAE